MSARKIKVKRLQNSPYAIDEGPPLGQGTFATIRRVYNTENSNEELVAKIISIKDQEIGKTIKSELQMLRELPNHPNLVNCIKIQMASQKNFYIIMEYCNQGNLEKYIFDHKNNLPEEKIWFFLKQFCDGYKVLYDRSIIHRDIKPENILIKDGNFKISDFGLSKVISDVEFNQNMSSKGTPLYMAPQLHYQKQGSSKVDVFSLGIILYRLAFNGKPPFFESQKKYLSIGQYFKQLKIKKLIFPAQHTRSQELVHLIQKMLVINKDKRIGWKEIFTIDRIKRAVRNEKRKQIVPMDQFGRSLLVTNSSVIDVKVIDGNNEQYKQNRDNDNCLIIEQAFNNKNRSMLEKKLYKNKLIYTLIDIANRRIQNTIKSQGNQIHSYIIKQLQMLINTGMKFCLKVISDLTVISGDWQSLKNGEILNFEEIFQNDKEIIANKLQSRSKDMDNSPYRIGTYQDELYQILTEYCEYPIQTQKTLRVVAGFLLQIYDIAIKIKSEEMLEFEDKVNVLNFQEEQIQKFQDFLYNLQNIKPEQIITRLKKMGLLLI